MKKRSTVFPKQLLVTRENEGEGDDEYLQTVVDPEGIESDQPVAFYELVAVRRMKVTREYVPIDKPGGTSRKRVRK